MQVIQPKQLKVRSYFFVLVLAVILFLVVFAGLKTRDHSARISLIGSSILLAALLVIAVVRERRLHHTITHLHARYNRLKQYQIYLIQREKMRAISSLTVGISHDIKNPLSVLNLGLHYVLGKVPQENETLKNLLKDLCDSVKKVDSVVDGIMNLSGLINVEPENININDPIRSSMEKVKNQVLRSQIKLQSYLAEPISIVAVNKLNMELVFENLLVNAIEALPHGGELVVSSYERVAKPEDIGIGRRAEDVFRAGDKIVVIDVEDNGPGVPASIIKRIFDPFYTTKKGRGQKGLGLAFISNVVQLQGGMISAENRKQGGLKMTVMLKTK